MSAGALPVPVPTDPAPASEPPHETPSGVEFPAGPEAPAEEVLRVRDLRTYFFTYDGVVRALEGVSFRIRRGETTGLVGETGCGKSVTAFSITQLIPDPPGRIMSGEIRFRGMNLLWGLEREATFAEIPGTPRVKIRRSYRRIKASNERMLAVRGRGISMIFQEPGQAMNPIFSVSNQIGESLLLHRGREIIAGLLAAETRAFWGGLPTTLNATEAIGPPPPAEPGAPLGTGPEAGNVTEAIGSLPPAEPETPLGTGPGAPNASEAIGRLLAAAEASAQPELRGECARIAELVRSPTLATELFYLLRDAGPAAADYAPEVERTIRKRTLTFLQRSYLQHRLWLAELDEKIKETYAEEMREERHRGGDRARLHRQRLLERVTHFYFGLWGIRSRIQRPIKQETFWHAVGMMEQVSIANPVQVARGFPHELSGGMLQRVMIAMALASEPALLIADEPTTALDVTIQAQILELMRDLKERIGTAILLITHDLGVIAEVADRVHVMYAGVIVESAGVSELFHRPLHPYSQGLLASIPRLDQPDKELASISGSVPNLISPPSGCRFHPRCPYAMPICKEARPPVTLEGPEHTVACYLYKGPVVVE